MNLPQKETLNIIKNSIKEDIWTGDITSEAVIEEDITAQGVILAKEAGIIAGLEVAELVFKEVDAKINFKRLIVEGAELKEGMEIAKVSGLAKSILSGERLALNFLQRMSAIATKTARYRSLVEDYKVKLVDTRKTTPGLRVLEKYAVRVGGGFNHRHGLYDAILIKDNHIRVAGGIKEALAKARNNISHLLKIEVETENLTDVKEALAAKADIIMLDNMSVELMSEAVEIINGAAIIEASGGITEKNIREVAATGVDIISLGALTHSIKALDISLNFRN